MTDELRAGTRTDPPVQGTSTAHDSVLESIIDAAMDAIISVDEDQRVVMFNAAAESMFQCSKEDAMHQPLDRFIPTRFRQSHEEHIRAFGQANVTQQRMRALGIVSGLRSDGTEFPVETSISHVQKDSQRIYTVVLRDLTDRQRLEQELKRRIDQQTVVADLGTHALRATEVVGLMDEAVVLVAKTLAVEYCNVLECLPGQSGLLLRAGAGWNDGLVGSAVVSSGADSLAGYALLSEEPVIVSDLARETRFSGPQLFLDHAVVSGISVCINGLEGPLGVVGAHTNRRRAFTTDDVHFMQCVANVIATAIDRQRVDEVLRRTERLAEFGTVASGLAHEIGTPMNVILGRAESLAEKTSEPATKKSLHIIIAQVERITKLMHQLLSFARHSSIENRAIDFARVIHDTLDIVQTRVSEQRVNVESYIQEAIPQVRADRDQMTQVVLNLVLNAIHAMLNGGTLRVKLDVEGPYVRLAIADTGGGIPPEQLTQIFEPFFTTKPPGEGTGLGLSIVKRIVEDHEGSIAVKSTLGEGTVFTIMFPIASAP